MKSHAAKGAERADGDLVGFISGRGLFYAKLAAAATLASLPVLIGRWIAQKQLIRGLTMGAVK